MYHGLFIHPPTEGHLGCFQVLYILKKLWQSFFNHPKFLHKIIQCNQEGKIKYPQPTSTTKLGENMSPQTREHMGEPTGSHRLVCYQCLGEDGREEQRVSSGAENSETTREPAEPTWEQWLKAEGVCTLQGMRASSPQPRLKGPREPSQFSSRSFLPELGHAGEKLLGRESRLNSRGAGEEMEKEGPNISRGREPNQGTQEVSHHILESSTKITESRALEPKLLFSNFTHTRASGGIKVKSYTEFF